MVTPLTINSHQVQNKPPDPNEKRVSTDPREVVMNGVRGEAARDKGGVVNAYDRVEQDLLQAAVEIRL